jgi:tRNA pseudouridine(55) synthase
MSFILEYKPIGMTPNEQMEILKKKYSIGKLCFVGRLDPMAHGLMMYLINDECKLMNNYLSSKKTYKFKILFGIETDSYDILGRIITNKHRIIDESALVNLLKTLRGQHNQKFPPFSSKRVGGKALWQHMKNGTIDQIDIPSKKININEINLNKFGIIDKKQILEIVNYKISNLKSEGFRKSEILSEWTLIEDQSYFLGEITADVSSGTYIRSICQQIGKDLNSVAIAFDILRTKIDNYQL